MWMRGLGDATNTTTPDTSNWLTALASLATQGLQVYNQQQVMDWYRSQLQSGKTVDPTVLNQLLATSTPGVQVGLSSSTQNVLVYGMVGAGALALLYMLMKTSGKRV